ncbi:MAG: alpha/beta hydrolase [Patescibacteria group bacterium]|nr:alpha/beta hydrolase [Patescibacteria group bacterium]
MKKQVIVIHGGTTFDTYEEYISYLKNREINIEKLKTPKGWKNSLEKELGADFEVFAPQMPDKTNARYEEWKIWFEKIIPFLNTEVILVGHSLGGIFLAKYLSLNLWPRKIKAVLLVAAPFDRTKNMESLSDFALPASLKKFAEQAGKIYLFQSQDDPSVPFAQADKYKKVLPNSEVIAFTDRQHFDQESFPELVELIKNI